MSEPLLTSHDGPAREEPAAAAHRFDARALEDRLRRYAAGTPPQAALELAAELRALHAAVAAAARVLDRVGITREAFEGLDDATRDSPFWLDVRRVWAARAVEPAADRCVLRFTRAGATVQHDFPSPRAALEAAIEAIETNTAYPHSIERDGAVLMDCAAILREWEERHIPG